MARTKITGLDVQDHTIQVPDIDTTTPGKALITKVIPGEGIDITYTGIDSGTGEVTIRANRTLDGGSPESVYTTAQHIDGGGP